MRRASLIIGAMLVAGCGSDEGLCDDAALGAALAMATPGQTVRIGACSVRGPLLLPFGVTLAGVGRDVSRIAGGSGQAAVRLERAASSAGTDPGVTTLSSLSIESNGFAVLAADPGANVALHDLQIDVRLGLGIGIADASAVEATGVNIVGPIGPANAASLPPQVSPMQTATYGLVLVRDQPVELSNVNIRGFALSGALSIDSTVTWTMGQVADNMGVGIAVEGGEFELRDVEITGMLKGVRLRPPFGAVFTSSAAVRSTNLGVSGGVGYGILHHTGTGRHTGFHADQNRESAIWAERVGALEIEATISNCGFAGMVIVDPEPGAAVVIEHTSITGTTRRPQVAGQTGLDEVGDGLHLVRSADSVELRDVSLTGNERVGALIELGAELLGPNTLGPNSIDVTATSTTQLGVVLQGEAAPPPDWDTNVVRHGIDAARDRATSNLPHVESVPPGDRPRENIVARSDIEQLVGPTGGGP